MPELPEVEHLRRTLEPWLVGARVIRVRLRRKDILTRTTLRGGAAARAGVRTTHPPTPSLKGRGRAAHALLAGERIVALRRHGKNLAIVGGSGRVLCVHLGMSGSLIVTPREARIKRGDHAHCVWDMERGRETKRRRDEETEWPTRGRRRATSSLRLSVSSSLQPFRLVFRDPRRFGGLWSFASMEELQRGRWDALGPDALTVTARDLRAALARTTRPVKAALLDQAVLAGVGNIYADEALFRAGIDPRTRANTIALEAVTRLASAIRHTLRRAIHAGGTTIISYVDGRGRSGAFAARLKVYGRGGEACVRCGRPLVSIVAGGRTTVLCPGCQAAPRQ